MQETKCQLLTPKGHLQGEVHHSPCRQIQAASLIYEGLPPTVPRFQTSEPVPLAAPDSC